MQANSTVKISQSNWCHALQKHGEREKIAQGSLQAFLGHLPAAGRSAIAQDIIGLKDDNGIFEYFRNL